MAWEIFSPALIFGEENVNSSLYIGATGMKGLAEGMHVTTNNIANVSTIGFKKQDMLFSDVMYQTQASMGDWWGADSKVAMGQVGQGLQVEAVRTKYTQGSLESTNRMTDLAINGKGFFQVTDGTNTFYTRAGDFVTDQDGVWRTPSGLALNGYKLNENGEPGELGQIQIDPNQNIAAKATSSINLIMNLQPGSNMSVNEENPFFSLMQSYDASAGKPLASDAYSNSQFMQVYDAEGNAHAITAYFDSAPVKNSSNRFMEFVIAADPSYGLNGEGEIVYPEAGSGLLMSGVLEFDAQGNLLNVSAFTPTEEGNKDLSTWQSASLNNGSPVFNLDGNEISLNFGVSTGEDATVTSMTAAEVGTDPSKLPGLGEDLVRAEFPTTSFASSSMTDSYKQDGFSTGTLTNVSVSSEGIITGYFSNGQTMDLFEIPVARFTSEDGLRREGSNLFSATPESGTMELGRAGTENYGEIQAYNIEGSNVDLANEMVEMIINQRGFQSNSKVVTTADQLLQKAMELKRQ